MNKMHRDTSIINIACIGGETYCRDFLEKTTMDYSVRDVNARFVAVADPNPESPGTVFAKELGLRTVEDYHELYDPEYNIHLFILFTPGQEILEDILATKPSKIRVQSYHVFEVFWKAMSIEEEKLRDRNEEVETILNGIQDFIIVINPDLEIVEVNDIFREKMGLTQDQIFGKKCYEIFQKLDYPCKEEDISCPLKEVVRNKAPVNQLLTRRRPDGNLRYIELSTYPIWEKDGKISKFVEISKDVTKRKKEEEEITRRLEKMVEERTRQLKDTHEQLLHKDKMASLGKLSASVVHEINNPIAGTLNMIMLMKRVISEGPVGDEDLKEFIEYLDLMATENERISKIIGNLLAFSRQSKVEPKDLDLNQLIEKTLTLNSNLFKLNHIIIDKHLNPKLPALLGSDDQLLQVFMNIVSNAVESMESAPIKNLYIETGHGSIKIDSNKNDSNIIDPGKNKLWILFKDTGTGIHQENIPKLFEPFFTTKKEGKGVGLGLSVAYGIIQNHKGTIEVQSEPEKGSLFKIEFNIDSYHWED